MLLEDLIEKIRKYNPESDSDLIKKAYRLAENIHRGEKRFSGDSLLVHLLTVANLTAEIQLDDASIIAALLHEAIRKGGLSAADIEKDFNPTVTFYVKTLTELSQNQLSPVDPKLTDNFKKTFLLLSKDIRVSLIRLADRVDNVRTISALPTRDQVWAARQALNFYAPIAEILGVYFFKRQLEDGAFLILHPEIYQAIADQLMLDDEEMEEAIGVIRKRLLTELAKEGVFPLRVFGRAKNLYSIWRKLLRYQKEGKIKDLLVRRIYDQMALMVITKEISECYEVLGVINRMFTTIPGEFDDYIAKPKPNGYRSLHTVIKDENRRIFEVQIKTEAMHQENEFGQAAHLHYKAADQKLAGSAPKEKTDWVKNLSEWSTVNIREILGEKIFVFSPKKDVYELPVGATPIDFAYAVHTNLGDKCVGAKIEGKMAPLDYKLETGQVVEIITAKGKKGPSRDWLKFVVTHAAKKEIEKHFRKE